GQRLQSKAPGPGKKIDHHRPFQPRTKDYEHRNPHPGERGSHVAPRHAEQAPPLRNPARQPRPLGSLQAGRSPPPSSTTPYLGLFSSGILIARTVIPPTNRANPTSVMIARMTNQRRPLAGPAAASPGVSLIRSAPFCEAGG